MVELATLALVATALAAVGFLAHRLGLPPAMGYLAVGIGAGALLDHIPGTHTAAELAVLVLLFLIGLELDLKRLREALGQTAWTLPFDILVPAVLVTGAARLVGWPFMQAAALGIALAVSSTLFGERLTAMPGVSGAPRRRVLGVLIGEDVAAGLLMAVLVVMASGATDLGTPAMEILRTLFLLLVMAAGAVWIVPRILDEVARRHVPELVVIWAIALIGLSGYLGHLAGSAELGALVAGVAAAEAGSRFVTRNSLSGLNHVAAALFFFASGAAVAPGALLAQWPIALLVAGAFFVAKHMVHVLAAAARGLNLPDSLRVAGALAAVGEFSLILVAVAEREGLAHPASRAVVVGAMVALLPLAAMTVRGADKTAHFLERMPRPVHRTLRVLLHGLRPRPSRGPRDWHGAARRLAGNLVLLVALGAFSAWVETRIPDFAIEPTWAQDAMWIGVTLAVASPLLAAAYKAYRDLVWSLVGLQPGERVGAGKVRARLVDAWVLATTVLVLAGVSLYTPRTIPVLLGGLAFAAMVGFVAWRRLQAFHRSVEKAIGRVLGEEGSVFLDEVLGQYPWGVRFTAISVPRTSPVVGKTLDEVRIGRLTGAKIAVIQRGKTELVNPPQTVRLRAGDHLVLLGDGHQIKLAEAVVVAHGDAVQLSAQSDAAEVVEIEVPEASPWVGKTLGEVDLRGSTGVLVIGKWSDGASKPVPFNPALVVSAGDRLILMGTPLQLERVRG